MPSSKPSADCVTPAARDKPSIDWNGDHKGDDEAKEQAHQKRLSESPAAMGPTSWSKATRSG